MPILITLKCSGKIEIIFKIPQNESMYKVQSIISIMNEIQSLMKGNRKTKDLSKQVSISSPSPKNEKVAKGLLGSMSQALGLGPKNILQIYEEGLGEQTIDQLSHEQILHYNYIELEIIEFQQQIRQKLGRFKRQEIGIVLIKVRGFMEQLEKICHELKIGFLCKLFQKIVICLTIMASLNYHEDLDRDNESNFLIFKKSQSNQTSYSSYQNKSVDISWDYVPEEQNVLENSLQNSQNTKKKKISSFEMKKRVMGGISLFNEDYKRHIEDQFAVDRFLDIFKVSKQKKRFWLQLQTDFKETVGVLNDGETKNNQSNSSVVSDKKEKQLDTIQIINKETQNDKKKGQKQKGNILVSMIDTKVFDYQIQLKDVSIDKFQDVMSSLASTYRNQKNFTLESIKKLINQIQSLYEQKIHSLAQQIQNYKSRITQLTKLLNRQKKITKNFSTQTLTSKLNTFSKDSSEGTQKNNFSLQNFSNQMATKEDELQKNNLKEEETQKNQNQKTFVDKKEQKLKQKQETIKSLYKIIYKQNISILQFQRKQYENLRRIQHFSKKMSQKNISKKQKNKQKLKSQDKNKQKVQWEQDNQQENTLSFAKNNHKNKQSARQVFFLEQNKLQNELKNENQQNPNTNINQNIESSPNSKRQFPQKSFESPKNVKLSFEEMKNLFQNERSSQKSIINISKSEKIIRFDTIKQQTQMPRGFVRKQGQIQQEKYDLRATNNYWKNKPKTNYQKSSLTKSHYDISQDLQNQMASINKTYKSLRFDLDLSEKSDSINRKTAKSKSLRSIKSLKLISSRLKIQRQTTKTNKNVEENSIQSFSNLSLQKKVGQNLKVLKETSQKSKQKQEQDQKQIRNLSQKKSEKNKNASNKQAFSNRKFQSKDSRKRKENKSQLKKSNKSQLKNSNKTLVKSKSEVKSAKNSIKNKAQQKAKAMKICSRQFFLVFENFKKVSQSVMTQDFQKSLKNEESQTDDILTLTEKNISKQRSFDLTTQKQESQNLNMVSNSYEHSENEKKIMKKVIKRFDGNHSLYQRDPEQNLEFFSQNKEHLIKRNQRASDTSFVFQRKQNKKEKIEYNFHKRNQLQLKNSLQLPVVKQQSRSKIQDKQILKQQRGDSQLELQGWRFQALKISGKQSEKTDFESKKGSKHNNQIFIRDNSIRSLKNYGRRNKSGEFSLLKSSTRDNSSSQTQYFHQTSPENFFRSQRNSFKNTKSENHQRSIENKLKTKVTKPKNKKSSQKIFEVEKKTFPLKEWKGIKDEEQSSHQKTYKNQFIQKSQEMKNDQDAQKYELLKHASTSNKLSECKNIEGSQRLQQIQRWQNNWQSQKQQKTKKNTLSKDSFVNRKILKTNKFTVGQVVPS